MRPNSTFAAVRESAYHFYPGKDANMYEKYAISMRMARNQSEWCLFAYRLSPSEVHLIIKKSYFSFYWNQKNVLNSKAVLETLRVESYEIRTTESNEKARNSLLVTIEPYSRNIRDAYYTSCPKGKNLKKRRWSSFCMHKALSLSFFSGL